MADLVDEVFGAAPMEAEVPQAEPTADVTAEPVATEPQPEPPAPTPVVEKDEERHVPLRTFLDTRDEAKEWKRKALALEAAQAKPAAVAPDSYDDPEGYNAYIERTIDERLTQQRFQISDVMAKQVHGEETVQKAVEWAQGRAQADPVFAASYMRDPNPIDWIVRQHKRDAIVSALPNDVSSLDELIEREIAKRGLTATATAAPIPVAVAPATKPAPPPRSIASDAPASRTAPEDNNADFMAIFNKR